MVTIDRPGWLSDDDVAADSNLSCKGHTVTIPHKNVIRVTLWSFISDTEWCYDGANIVGDPAWSIEGRAKTWLGWRYRGTLSESESGGDGQTSHYDYAQGHFQYCVIKVGCSQNYHPTIKKWQYGDGTHKQKSRK